jgi:phosphohistidine phosphatase
LELILLRHGKAEDRNLESDRIRALVEAGYRQARQAGELLKSSGGLPDIVLTSPVLRAHQTAEVFCEAAGIPGPVTQAWLACGMDPETALSELKAYREFSRVAIVGHEPDFSELLQWLLGVKGGWIEVKKGTLACIEIRPPTRHGRLLYLIPPSLSSDRKSSMPG